MSLLKKLNQQYLDVHTAKEEAFWSSRMGLQGYRQGEYESREIALKAFASDANNLPLIRSAMAQDNLSENERIGLQGWQHYFTANAIESAEARALQEKIIRMEGQLDEARRAMDLGYTDPQSGEFVPCGSVELALKMIASDSEPLRRAAWQGLASIEQFVLEKGFLDIVKERNRLGRMLGYEDYYDYKVSINEGFSKRKLFTLLDELEVHTREACREGVEQVVKDHGPQARDAWNFDNLIGGSLASLLDPYMRFATSLDVWGRSFAAMGVKYNGASLTLDLVNRRGKYENGFMHGPLPCFVDEGRFRPARINFTANAVPGQVGSGKRAIETLLHEGGHAAHFSNIRMPAPCFSQEFAPFSVAMAETQSMFFDSLMGDADWLWRYARNEAGESLPFDISKRFLRKEHVFRAGQLRKMLTVCYAEKALYEMPESDLTPERIMPILRDIERRMLFLHQSGRPILSIPHLLSGEASAYYHGYVLARMAVIQTRAYFLERDGFLLDNPAIGPSLADKYWQPGNSRSFLDLVEDLTGEAFSAKATVALVNKPLELVYEEAEAAVERAKKQAPYEGPVDLQADITVAHGDQHIARSSDAASFQAMSDTFASWIRGLESAR